MSSSNLEAGLPFGTVAIFPAQDMEGKKFVCYEGRICRIVPLGRRADWKIPRVALIAILS